MKYKDVKKGMKLLKGDVLVDVLGETVFLGIVNKNQEALGVVENKIGHMSVGTRHGDTFNPYGKDFVGFRKKK